MWHFPCLPYIYSSVFEICDIFARSMFVQIHFFARGTVGQPWVLVNSIKFVGRLYNDLYPKGLLTERYHHFYISLELLTKTPRVFFGELVLSTGVFEVRYFAFVRRHDGTLTARLHYVLPNCLLVWRLTPLDNRKDRRCESRVHSGFLESDDICIKPSKFVMGSVRLSKIPCLEPVSR